MEFGCSLYALLACFSWSSLYVDGGLSFQDSSPVHQEWQTQINARAGAIETVRTQFTTDRPLNPYGRVALGYEVRFGSVTMALEASHVSSVETTADRGVNAIGIRARWYPFK